MSGLIKSLPYLGLAVVVYLVGVMLVGVPLTFELFAVSLPSGAPLRFLYSDLILLLALMFFFLELLMSTRPTQSSLLNHALSMALFILCGILFMLVPACGTMTFFFLLVLTLIDVVAGYSISIITARRDLTLERSI